MVRSALLALLLTGCPEAPPPAPVADEAPEAVAAVDLDVTGARGSGRAFAVQVLHARAEPGDEGWTLTLDVRFDHTRPDPFLGLVTQARAVALPRDGMVLLADDEDLVPTAASTFEALAKVPVEQPRILRGELVYALPPGALPERLALQVGSNEGTAYVPLRGGLLTLDDEPAVGVIFEDAAGLPVQPVGTVTADGVPVEVPEPFLPWRLPVGEGSVALEARLAGWEPVSTAVAPGDEPVRIRLVPSDPVAAARAALAPEPPPAEGLLGTMDPGLDLPDVDTAWRYVKEQIAIAPTLAMQRSPDAVVRWGQGSPLERAVLLRDLIRRQGHQADLVCGDLPDEQADALYDGFPEPPAPPPELAAALAEGREAVSALAPALAAALETLPEGAPEGAMARYRIRPEWCDVDTRPDDDSAWRRLDLRPAPLDAEPPMFEWRVVEGITRDLWRMRLELIGSVRTPAGDWDSVTLISRDMNAGGLTETALLIDVIPDGALLRSQVMSVGDDLVGGVVGAPVSASGLESLALVVSWADPHGVAAPQREVQVWQRGREARDLSALRLLVGLDPHATPASVSAHLRALAPQGHPVPGALALWTRLDRYSLLRHHLADGALPLWPTVHVLAGVEDVGGTPSWWWRALPEPAPMWLGEPPDTAARARYAAVEAVARALALDVPPPAAPTRWIRTADEAGGLPPRGQDVQMDVVRHLDEAVYGAEDGGSVWVLDRDSGGLGPYRLERPLRVRTPEPTVSSGDPRWAHEHWSLPALCEAGARAGRPVSEDLCPAP